MYFRDANGNIYRQKPQPKTNISTAKGPQIPRHKIEFFGGESFQSISLYGPYIIAIIVLIVLAIYMMKTYYSGSAYPKRFGYRLY